MRVAPRLQKSVWKLVYGAASRGTGEGRAANMNYGYASAEDARGDYGIQLYDHVVSAHDLRGRDVLDVGCGRGGGTAFVFDHHGPRSMIGLDLARSAIAECRRRYARPGLTFIPGDAEALPFADASFDVVLNVESSHCYPDVPHVLDEMYRVLRPEGLVLMADVRVTTMSRRSRFALLPRSDVSQLRAEVRASRFNVLEEEDITANVLLALQLDTPRRRVLIEDQVPRLLRPRALAFAAVEGTPLHRSFASGEVTYLRFVLQKAAHPAHDRRRAWSM